MINDNDKSSLYKTNFLWFTFIYTKRIVIKTIKNSANIGHNSMSKLIAFVGIIYITFLKVRV